MSTGDLAGARVLLGLGILVLTEDIFELDGNPQDGAIVEFSDFHCPFCKKVQPTLTEVLSRYPDKVKLVYRAAPIDSLHPHAREAAGAVKCAHEQGRFWAYHDKLYARESDASLEH